MTPSEQHAEETFTDGPITPELEPAAPEENPAATKTYRFIGSFQTLSDVGDLSEFGQKVELTDAQFAAHGPRAQVITEQEWKDHGFTDEDAEKHANPADHEYFDLVSGKMVTGVPQEFLDKKKKALTAMQQRHAEGA